MRNLKETEENEKLRKVKIQLGRLNKNQLGQSKLFFEKLKGN